MPELPDLEVYKENVWNRLTAKRLCGVEVCNAIKVQAPQAMLSQALVGEQLLEIRRSGKELYFDFGPDKILGAHLMLNGTMSFPEDAARVPFAILLLRFEAQTLAFADRGGLCTIKFNPAPGRAPDALDEAFSLDYFLALAKKRARLNIKALLIDQSLVRGIGNAYADEILWAARVSPYSVAGRIPHGALLALYQSIGVVLREAIVSIKRVAPGIISGEERSFLNVHTKTRKTTETGHPILVEQVASKITYYTREQVLYQ